MMVSAIHQYELAVGMHVSPPFGTPSHLPPHQIPPSCHRAWALGVPLRISNSHWLSVLLVICHLYISVLFSQIIPPSPSPTELKSLS